MRYIGTISKYFHFPYEGMYGNSGIEYIEKTVTGNGYVDLLTAKNGSLSNLTLFGGMEQDDTDVLQSVVLDGATVQRNVPEGYTELDYLRNVMNSTKFNTELTPQNGDVLELVRTAGSPTVSNYMFQSREGTQAGIYGISGSSSGGTIMGNRGSGQSLQSEILRTNGHKYYTKMSVIGTTLTLTVKDLTDNIENTRTREITETAGGPSKYFLWGNATQQQALGTAQNVYYASITTNGVERIKLIPAKQGNTIGFYDMVSKTFMSTFVGDEPTPSTEEATPSPFVPMDIVCNNGALKVSRNLFDMSKAERGDIASATGIISTTVSYRIVSDYIPVQVGQSYTASGKICFEGVANEYDARLIIAFYDSSKAYISASRTTSPLLLTVPDNGASYIRVEYWGDQSTGYTVDTDRSKLQFEIGTTATDYMPYSQIYTDGTIETITDNLGNTATAEMLLNVGDLADTQEVLSGNITRKVGIKVFDGTENWNVYSVTQGNLFRTILNDSVSNNKVQLGVLCNYYSVVDTNDRVSGTLSGTVTNYDFINNDYTTLDEWKNYLFGLYANGTPVIIVYPLATATTSSVEGQELIKKPITQTAGSISNMTITVTSDGGIPSPTTPKDIICNNGILKYNTTSQTIYTEGDIETVKDSGNRTATAEMLLKIGTYIDSQEVLSGAVARKVGIKVFDGTETFQEYQGVGGRYRYTIALSNTPSLNGIAYSSHFVGGKTLAELNADTTITQAVGLYTNKLRFYTTTYETLSAFTSFLAQQYANGTPVIAIYTFATATTETVTGQNLNVKSGTNKIEITQASIDNLGISATYLSRE